MILKVKSFYRLYLKFNLIRKANSYSPKFIKSSWEWIKFFSILFLFSKWSRFCKLSIVEKLLYWCIFFHRERNFKGNWMKMNNKLYFVYFIFLIPEKFLTIAQLKESTRVFFLKFFRLKSALFSLFAIKLTVIIWIDGEPKGLSGEFIKKKKILN